MIWVFGLLVMAIAAYAMAGGVMVIRLALATRDPAFAVFGICCMVAGGYLGHAVITFLPIRIIIERTI